MSEIAEGHESAMSEVANECLVDREEVLAPDEIANIISNLSNGDKTALMKIARHYARKTPYDFEDLVNEAFSRVLDPARRSWRRGTPAVMLLGSVIRSIAWQWRHAVASELLEIGDGGAGERGTTAKMEAMQIVAAFADDVIAQKIIIGIMQGCRGEELEEALGLSKTEYESKRKKIRRRIEKMDRSETA
jgi:hypothetical protein